MSNYDSWSKALRDAVTELKGKGDRFAIYDVQQLAGRLLFPESDFDAQDATGEFFVLFQGQCKEDGYRDGSDEWEHPDLPPDFVGSLGPSKRTNEEVMALVERVISGDNMREVAKDQEEVVG
jgi:hypothetical protein